jgi:hypothetical protein
MFQSLMTGVLEKCFGISDVKQFMQSTTNGMTLFATTRSTTYSLLIKMHLPITPMQQGGTPMNKEPVALVLSGKRFRIVQHFYNSRNLGESWWKTLQRVFMGWLLTDYRYAHYLDDIWDDDNFLSVEETTKFLQGLGLADEDGNIITEENIND